MQQDYRQLSSDEIESIEKQSLRTVVQAVQEYSEEARQLFETTEADSESEVIVLAEDIVQYALEVAECYPINKRFAGFIDYKRVRWISTPFGLFPQVLLGDAKASTENNRDTLQRSQLPMDAEYVTRGKLHTMKAGVGPHLDIPATTGVLAAVTTSLLVHFYYQDLGRQAPPYRNLRSIFILALPHQQLKPRYNPNPQVSFFGAGKHSPGRGEEPRIRVYFDKLRSLCPWRLQELHFVEGSRYTNPIWRDVAPGSMGATVETLTSFDFIGR